MFYLYPFHRPPRKPRGFLPTYAVHIMRFIFVLFACLLMTVAPVRAQDYIPTPTQPLSETQILREMTDIVERFSADTNTTVNASVVILGIGFLILMGIIAFAALRLMTPLFRTMTDYRQDLDFSRDQIKRLMAQIEAAGAQQEQRDSLLGQFASTGERTANILSLLETHEQADQARTTAVEQINTHTDAAIESMRTDLTHAVTAINEARAELEKAVSKDDLTHELKPISEQLQAIEDRLKTIQDNLPPCVEKPSVISEESNQGE